MNHRERAAASKKHELLVDEYFETQSPAFLDSLRQVQNIKKIAAVADRMKADNRPWVRDQLLAYLALPLDCPGHHPLVKRLYKDAEQRADDELLAAFAVAFDRLVRRRLSTQYNYDWQTRTTTETQKLTSPGWDTIHPKWGYAPPNGKLFTLRTRHYLRRRVWRYFRHMGYGQPDAYVAAVSMALRLYRDEDLETGPNILDCRTLLQICYHGSEILVFTRTGTNLKPDRALAELKAAPRFPELWQTPEAGETLLQLAREAQAHLVRLWATQMLQAQHQSLLENLGADALAELLTHPDESVQGMALELLQTSPLLERATMDFWLKLLEHDNPMMLPTLCTLMEQKVTPDRLSLAKCVDLACAAASPVAKLGLSFLRGQKIATAADRAQVARLAGLNCDAMGRDLTAWALPRIGAEDVYQRDQLCDFLDSLQPSVRETAWEWLLAHAHAAEDPVIWARLSETPWDDMRLRLVSELDRRAKLVTDTEALSTVWTGVLLAVHRGGRRKPQALRQIADAIAARPDAAPELLPVLAVAVRSIRGPEMRAGLAAVVSLCQRRPELVPAVEAALPELKLQPEGA